METVSVLRIGIDIDFNPECRPLIISEVLDSRMDGGVIDEYFEMGTAPRYRSSAGSERAPQAGKIPGRSPRSSTQNKPQILSLNFYNFLAKLSDMMKIITTLLIKDTFSAENNFFSGKLKI